VKRIKEVVVKSAVNGAIGPFVAAKEDLDFCVTEKPAEKSSNILALKTKVVVAIFVGEEEGKLSVAAGEVSSFWLTKRHAKKSLVLVIKTKVDVVKSAATEVAEQFVAVREVSGCWRTRRHAK